MFSINFTIQSNFVNINAVVVKHKNMIANIKVSVIIVNDKNEVLLLKEKVKKNDRPLWNIIKGTYGDNGDETILEAAKRECMEEASVAVDLAGATGCYATGKTDDLKIQFNFIGRISSGEPKIDSKEEQESRNEDIREIKWFSKDQLIQMPKEDFISEKIFVMISDWIKGESYPLAIIKQF